jgi:hypothetical protein
VTAIQFLSGAGLGALLVVLAAKGDSRAIHASQAGRLVALALGLVLVVVALFGAWRASRMRLLATGDGLTIVGLVGRRSVPADRIVQWGFTRAGVGQALYFLTDDDQPLVVRAVSSAARTPVSAEAEAVPRSLPGLRRARPTSAADPLPRVPVAVPDFSPTAPTGGMVVWTAAHDPDLSAPIRSFVLRYSALGLVIAVYLVGFAVAAPGHAGLIAAAGGVFVVIFAASLAGVPLLLRRAAVMLDGATVARRQPGRGWQSFDLKALRGVGFKRDVSVLGILGSVAVVTSLVLVDDAGHRFELPVAAIGSAAGEALGHHLTAYVSVTRAAQAHLSAG